MTTSQARTYRESRRLHYVRQVNTYLDGVEARISDANSLEEFHALLKDVDDAPHQDSAARERQIKERIERTRRQWYAQAHPQLAPVCREHILAGRIGPGMTAEQARASWGEPSDINRTISTYGVSEQWIYSVGKPASYPLYLDTYQVLGYVYLDNGVVSMIPN
jgi:hypothetical protein